MKAVKDGEATAARRLVLDGGNGGRQNRVGGLSHSCGITPLLVHSTLYPVGGYLYLREEQVSEKSFFGYN